MSEQTPKQDANANSSPDESIDAKIHHRIEEVEERIDLPALEERAAERRRSLRRSAYMTAAVGLVFSFFFIATIVLSQNLPKPNASDEEILAYYGGSQSSLAILVGTYVMPFAGIAFLWFIVTLRIWISASAKKISDLTSNMQLISGIIFISVFFVAAAAIATSAVSAEYMSSPVSPDIARQLPQFGMVLILVFANRMAAIFVFTTSTIGLGSRVMPRWFAVAGYVVGAFLLLITTLSPSLAFVFPLWMIVLCVILLVRARQIPADAVVPRRGETLPSPGKTN